MADDLEKELVEYLGGDFESLPLDKQSLLLSLYKKNRKSGVIYLWWLISTPFAFHYAYVKNWKLFALFTITLGGLCVWWVIDLFRLMPILRLYNQELARKLIEGLD